MAPTVDPTRGCAALCCIRFLCWEPSTASHAAGTQLRRVDGLRQTGRASPVVSAQLPAQQQHQCRGRAGACSPGGPDEPLLGQSGQSGTKTIAARSSCASLWGCVLACPAPAVLHARTAVLAARPCCVASWAAAPAALGTWRGAAAQPQRGWGPRSRACAPGCPSSRPPASALQGTRLVGPGRTSVGALGLETPVIGHPSAAQGAALHLSFAGGQSRTG